MKREALIVAVFSMASYAFGQGTGQQTQQQNPPAAGQSAPPAAGAAQTPAAPPTKRPPQAKTQPEMDAYSQAVKVTDPAGLEKASDDFAAKFPDSELRVLLFKTTTRAYQNTNNPDKTEASARKVLAIDPDDPESLVMVAEVIAERTHDSDLDKDQRYAEAMKMADKATQTVDTDLSVPADKMDVAKAFLRSSAYSIIGTIEFKKENYPAAETALQKSIDAFPQQPDPVVVLRLAIALDKQNKIPDALKVANRAVDMTQDNTQVGTLARRERDRLQQLSGAAAPATPPATPPKN